MSLNMSSDETANLVNLIAKCSLPSSTNKAALSRVLARLEETSAGGQGGSGSETHRAGSTGLAGAPSAAPPRAKSVERPRSAGAAEAGQAPRSSTPQGGRRPLAPNPQQRPRTPTFAKGTSTANRGMQPQSAGKASSQSLQAANDQLMTALGKNRELEATVASRDEEIKNLKLKVVKLQREKNALASKDTAGGDQLQWGQHDFGEGKRGDVRVQQSIKILKQCERERDEALLLAKQTAKDLEDLKRKLQDREEELQYSHEGEQAARVLLQEELNSKLEMEKKLEKQAERRRAELAEMQRVQEQMHQVSEEMAKVEAGRQELLKRTVQRDHKIEALQKKLGVAAAHLQDETARRVRCEEEMDKFESRMGVIRRKNAALESRVAVEESAKAQSAAELQIKEEECRLLASMVTLSMQGADPASLPSAGEEGEYCEGEGGGIEEGDSAPPPPDSLLAHGHGAAQYPMPDYYDPSEDDYGAGDHSHLSR